MKTIKNNICLALALILCVPALLAGDDIIASKDLFKIMNNKDVVIISAQTAEQYKKVHIKNAVHINHKDLYKTGDVKSMLKPANELSGILGSKGISSTKTLVVYDQGSGKYSGRIYWILKYLGCSDVKILDGQLKGWMAARKPITKNPTITKKATFTPKVSSAIMANMADVKSGKYTIVDVRAVAEYNGTEGETEKKGHIPGAINMDFKKVLDDKSAFKNAEDIKSALSAAGIKTDKGIILYCTSSVRAGIVYAALTDILNISNVKVYDGALYEWIAKGNKLD